MEHWTFAHEDDNGDGINDYVAVYSREFGKEPLIGDYRGVEMARINYIPCRPDSIARAEQIAKMLVAAHDGEQVQAKYAAERAEIFERVTTPRDALLSACKAAQADYYWDYEDSAGIGGKEVEIARMLHDAITQMEANQ